MCHHSSKREVLLKQIRCKGCCQSFLICGSCFRGHAYCGDGCQVKAVIKAHRRNQSKYRTSPKGRRTNKLAAKRHRIKKSKKTVADRSSKLKTFPFIVDPNLIYERPVCRICGVSGRVVMFSPAQAPFPGSNHRIFSPKP